MGKNQGPHAGSPSPGMARIPGGLAGRRAEPGVGGFGATRPAVLAAVLALALGTGGFGLPAFAQAPSLDWSSQNLNLDNNRFAPLDEIDASNVGGSSSGGPGWPAPPTTSPRPRRSWSTA